MDSITLRFNVNVAKLQELGVDPTTSEGKAKLREFFLSYAEAGVGASHVNLPADHEDNEILGAFLEV